MKEEVALDLRAQDLNDRIGQMQDKIFKVNRQMKHYNGMCSEFKEMRKRKLEEVEEHLDILDGKAGQAKEVKKAKTET